MNAYGLYTLFYKEVLRFSKVALQTLGAPIVTSLLYLLVFSHVLEGHVRVYPEVSYTRFLIPGLIMMAVIQNAFANSSSSIIQSKVTGNLVFILLSPLAHLELYLAFVLAAMVRALLVGLGIYLVALTLVALPLAHPWALLAFLVLAAGALGSLGIIAGIWADKFDQLAGFQNFIIMPLSFLSGVFYSLHSLPPFWRTLSHYNPFFYMIDGFRYGFFGHADVSVGLSLGVCALFFMALAGLSWWLLARGYKLRG